jgi:phenylacetate-CoA ligase
MIFSERLRYYFFWFFDFLKKSPVARSISQIKETIENHENYDTYVIKSLELLTNEITEKVEFYNRYKGLPFESFPIIDKNLIRNNQANFLSKKYTLKDLIPLTTSGSTGTPFTVYHDNTKRNRNTADTIYFAQRGGYDLGTRLYYLKIWSDYNKKSTFLRFTQNIVAIDVLNLSTNVKLVIKKLVANKKSIALLGYVSAFETLSKFLDRNPLKNRLKVSSIITMSESLDEHTKFKMEEHCQEF